MNRTFHEGKWVAVKKRRTFPTFGKRSGGKLLLAVAFYLGLQAVMKSCGASLPDAAGKNTIGDAMRSSLAREAQGQLYMQFMPGLAFVSEGGGGRWFFWQEQITALFPFFGYGTGDTKESPEETTENLKTILLAEAEEGTWHMEEDLAEDSQGTLTENTQKPAAEEGGEEAQDAEQDMEALLREENEAALRLQEFQDFVPHGKMNQVDLEPLRNYETLIRQFYTIDANTTAGSDQLNVDKLLGEDMRISGDSEGPQILIYHTHSQEAFSDSIPGDASTSIMGVGEHLTQILRERYGYEVLHHMGQYDLESRDDSYSVALSDIEQVLKEYPSIQVVIDLHRDEMPETTRLVMDLDGRPTARFMFFNGLSRTKKTGNIAYLYNENLDGNLAFSFQMQLKAVEYYPNLTRRIYLKGYRYNMHLRPKSLLIELGAQNNTLEEAMNACDPLAHILDLVLSGEE